MRIFVGLQCLFLIMGCGAAKAVWTEIGVDEFKNAPEAKLVEGYLAEKEMEWGQPSAVRKASKDGRVVQYIVYFETPKVFMDGLRRLTVFPSGEVLLMPGE